MLSSVSPMPRGALLGKSVLKQCLMYNYFSVNVYGVM